MSVVLRPPIPNNRERDAHGSLFERKILVKSLEPGNKAQRKVEKLLKKISAEIITENYELVYQSRRKCEIYRDTGVSKKKSPFYLNLYYFFFASIFQKIAYHSIT